MNSKLRFTKMHGLGNDFVMLSGPEAIPEGVSAEALARFLCDRHFGIGADGLIYPAPASDPERFAIQFVYLNSDGSRAEMCGNGIRCFALYVRERGLVRQDRFVVETLAGPICPQINPDGTVTVDMGPPILEAARIPFENPAVLPEQSVEDVCLEVLGASVPVTAVSMGNPHCLVFQDDLPSALEPALYGPALEKHPVFPAKTNVEFVQVLDPHRVKVTVWERGCGFTLACGTGACATAVGGILLNKVQSPVTVELPGGPLSIVWDGQEESHVFMTGPAQTVFHGEVELPLADLKALAVTAT